MSDKMTLREVLAELQAGAPVKPGLKSGYYFCGLLPENWESMIEEEHRHVTSIYDSIDPDEKPGTICILVDGLIPGKYYSSKEYEEGKGSAHGRRKTDDATAGL